MTRSQRGFTLVELIIVIITIGILAGIVIVAWSGAVAGARDKARASDTQNWAGLFDTYSKRYVVWPLLPTTNGPAGVKTVCLGTPTSGNGKCVQYGSAFSTQYISTTSGSDATDFNTINTAVAHVGSVPVNSASPTRGSASGPFIYLWQLTPSTTVNVTGVFMNFFEGSSCPSGFTPSSSLISGDPTNYAELSLLLTNLPSNVQACGIVKTMSYTPS